MGRRVRKNGFTFTWSSVGAQVVSLLAVVAAKELLTKYVAKPLIEKMPESSVVADTILAQVKSVQQSSKGGPA